MRICVIAEGYPYKEDPFLPFVRALFVEIVKMGHECCVISPQSISRAICHHVPMRPQYWEDVIDENVKISVYQPYYLSLSNRLTRISNFMLEQSAKSVFKKIRNKTDVLYAHFWHMGVIAAKLNSDLPLFVACGESEISVKNRFNDDEINKLLEQLSGMIYVGSKSYKESQNLGLQKQYRYIIAPNGFDPNEFYIEDKETCRKQLGYSTTKKIVSFVGAFSERKGVNRLLKALKLTNSQPDVILIGNGEIEEEYENIVFKGKLPHDQIRRYLCASDLFVLPTQNEGCCNAIVEALACGLPVISSDQDFNDDILNEFCSVRVDPTNISQLAMAIDEVLMDDKILNDMHTGAGEQAEKLKLPERARRIVDFIQKAIEDN